MVDARESQLLEQARRGDRAALGELLGRYQNRLYNLCLRMVGDREDAAELTQEAMLKVIEHIHDYNGQSTLLTWMTRICMNLAISHLRKQKLRRMERLEEAGTGREDQAEGLRRELIDWREPDPQKRVQDKEASERVERALWELEEDLRAILVLRDIQQMEYAEIGAVLSIPVGTVRSRLFRARLALRRILQEQEEKKGIGETRSSEHVG